MRHVFPSNWLSTCCYQASSHLTLICDWDFFGFISFNSSIIHFTFILYYKYIIYFLDTSFIFYLYEVFLKKLHKKECVCAYIYTHTSVYKYRNVYKHAPLPCTHYLCAIIHVLCLIINSILLHHLLYNLKLGWEKYFYTCLCFLWSFPFNLDVQNLKEELLQSDSVPARLFEMHVNKLLVSLIKATLPKHYLPELQEHFCKVLWIWSAWEKSTSGSIKCYLYSDFHSSKIPVELL